MKQSAGNKFFVDSSLLVNYLRRSKYSSDDLVNELIIDDRVCINGIVVTELLAGSKRNEAAIAICIGALTILKMDDSFFIRSAQLIKKLKGLTLPLSDIYIAQHCLDNELTLLGNDKHFCMIKEKVNLNYRQIDSKKIIN